MPWRELIMRRGIFNSKHFSSSTSNIFNLYIGEFGIGHNRIIFLEKGLMLWMCMMNVEWNSYLRV